jgi:hypothetical protein
LFVKQLYIWAGAAGYKGLLALKRACVIDALRMVAADIAGQPWAFKRPLDAN